MDEFSELSDAVVRSRRMKQDGHDQLDPPAEFPTLFSCKCSDSTAIGCVYRNGIVLVMPDRLQNGLHPTIFPSMGAVDDADFITEIVWEWKVSRLL